MCRVYKLAALGAFVVCLVHTQVADAQVVQVSAGAKGFAGGNLWTTPSSRPWSYEGLGFAGNAGGFGFGAGAYVEARFIKFLGLEIDAIYDSSSLYRDVTYSSLVKVREKVTTSGMRVPLLAKGILPVPFGRLSLFVGPEFVFATSPSGSIEITTGAQYMTAADQARTQSFIHGKAVSSTMFTMGLGIAVELPASLEIPIELRASKNMSQPDAWMDRVDIAPPAPDYTVRAQSSWDFRLGLGLGYRF